MLFCCSNFLLRFDAVAWAFNSKCCFAHLLWSVSLPATNWCRRISVARFDRLMQKMVHERSGLWKNRTSNNGKSLTGWVVCSSVPPHVSLLVKNLFRVVSRVTMCHSRGKIWREEGKTLVPLPHTNANVRPCCFVYSLFEHLALSLTESSSSSNKSSTATATRAFQEQ